MSRERRMEHLCRKGTSMGWDEKHGHIKAIMNDLKVMVGKDCLFPHTDILHDQIRDFLINFERNDINQNDAIKETKEIFKIFKQMLNDRILVLISILNTWSKADPMYGEEHKIEHDADFNLDAWPTISFMPGELPRFFQYIRRRWSYLKVQITLISTWEKTSKRKMEEPEWSIYKCESDDTCTEGIPNDVDRFIRTIGIGFTKNELATLFENLKIGKRTRAWRIQPDVVELEDLLAFCHENRDKIFRPDIREIIMTKFSGDIHYNDDFKMFYGEMAQKLPQNVLLMIIRLLVFWNSWIYSFTNPTNHSIRFC